ncbi:MAG TPA: polymer-forming cytoskeletal protein [Thermoflexus sp.]|nr:polymer-forming cytoskeletal protein [Thermoflexus sp.]
MTIWMMLLTLFIALAGQTPSGDPPPNQVVIGSDFVLPAGSRMEGDVVVIGGEARVEADAHLNGDLIVLGGPAVVDGIVEGDVIVLGSRVGLGPSARVRGDLVAPAGALERSPGAIVNGRLVVGPRVELRLRELLPAVVPPEDGLMDLANRAFRALLGGLALILLALVVSTLFPGPVAQNARVIQQAPAISLGIGVPILLFSVVLILLLAITLIGIPLAVIALALFIGAVLFGLISFGYLIGSRLDGSLPSGWPPAVRISIGVGIVWLLWALADLLPLCGGPVIRLALVALAVGSTFLSRFGMRPYPPQPLAPAGEDRVKEPPAGESPLEALPVQGEAGTDA